MLGEVVLLIEGRTGETRWSEAEVRSALSTGLGAGERLKSLSTDVAKRSGWSAQELYKLGLSIK